MSSVETTTDVQIPQGTWKVDPVHSTVEFRVRDFIVAGATIRGRFTDFEGTIEADDDGGRASGAIRTASLTTDDEQRDGHLRSPDFLDTEQFPEIRFESTAIEPAGDGKLTIGGDLTIQGGSTPLELVADFRGPLTDQWGNERIVIEARGRIEWGETVVELAADVSSIRA